MIKKQVAGPHQFPKLEPHSPDPTRDALHAYARVMGDWLKSCRPKRKHWWHASLRPSLAGLTTGTVHAATNFELVLDLRESVLLAHTSAGSKLSASLDGQSAADIAEVVNKFLADVGVHAGNAAESDSYGADRFVGYSADRANSIGQALAALDSVMAEFRSGIKEETSPIQLWPHHFDLSMLWLPGEKIDGQDPDNEEYADKQMNFGFTFGDEGIPDPYFYVTAYPLPDGFPGIELPTGAEWHTEGFTGAVLRYKNLIASNDPHGYLLDLWAGLLSGGREHMLARHAAS